MHCSTKSRLDCIIFVGRTKESYNQQATFVHVHIILGRRLDGHLPPSSSRQPVVHCPESVSYSRPTF